MAWGEDNYGEFRWGEKFPSGSSGLLKQSMDSVGLKLMGIRKPRIHTNTVQGDAVISNGWFIDFTIDYFSNKQVARLDFRQSGARQWYWDSFVNEGNGFETGIIGYWNDEADEYGGNFMFMQMQRAQYEGQRLYNNQRVWSINRNFYLGAQRFGYSLWSGDISSGFESMAQQRLFMLTSINLGTPWWGMDIGGFHGTPTAENYFRWIQFGAFVPVFRVHGTYGEEREPWNYGPEAEAIATRYIRLRYELMPYIYSAAYQTHLTGIPMVRSLVFTYPEDLNVRNIYQEWFFGNDILVHPIIEPGIDQVIVYIPEGEWIDFHSGKVYNGSGSISYAVQRENIPVFVRAGSIIPMAKAGAYVDDPETSNLLRLCSFGRGYESMEIYEDDGISYDYENSDFTITTVQHTRTSDKAEILISGSSGIFTPPNRDYLPEFYFCPEPDSVLLDGNAISRISLDSLLGTPTYGWSYDHILKKAFVRFSDDQTAHSVEVFFIPDTDPPQVDTVGVISDSTIYVGFSEPVKMDGSVNGALNPDNYQINRNITINGITAPISHDAVILNTSVHEKNILYTLEISNIVDQSDLPNIMDPFSFDYSIPTLYYFTLQDGINGYQGTNDSHIAENFPNNNMGGNDRFEAARYAGDFDLDDKSALVGFDISHVNIPDTTLIQAQLILTLAETRNGETAKDIGVYRLLQSWNQGRGLNIDGESALAGEVTWNSARHGTESWQTPGGNSDPVASDIQVIYSGTGNIYTWDITKFVRFWSMYPDSNFGVLLKEPEPVLSHGTKVFYSSEYDDPLRRPKLKFTLKDPVTGIIADTHRENLPEEFFLGNNFPNPFNPKTTIEYHMPKAGNIKLTVFNTLGQKIKTLMHGPIRAGRYRVEWDGTDLAGVMVSSGIYFYRMEADQFVKTEKMMLIK